MVCSILNMAACHLTNLKLACPFFYNVMLFFVVALERTCCGHDTRHCLADVIAEDTSQSLHCRV